MKSLISTALGWTLFLALVAMMAAAIVLLAMYGKFLELKKHAGG